MSWHHLDKEIQDANLSSSCPAILTETPNQVKLIVPEASAMAHTFQPTVCTGEMEPQRRRLACWVGAEGGYYNSSTLLPTELLAQPELNFLLT